MHACIFQESAVCFETLLLCDNVCICNCALPQRGVLQERPEYGVRFIWGSFELLCCFLVTFFSNFPDLKVNSLSVSGYFAMNHGRVVSYPHLVSKPLWQRQRAKVLLLRHVSVPRSLRVSCREKLSVSCGAPDQTHNEGVPHPEHATKIRSKEAPDSLDP